MRPRLVLLLLAAAIGVGVFKAAVEGRVDQRGATVVRFDVESRLARTKSRYAYCTPARTT